MKYNTIFFDLDGTLVDTSRGIHNSVRYVQNKMKLPKLQEGMLNEFIGPPPKDMYKKIYSLNEKDAVKATTLHRQYGNKYGVCEVELYPYIKKLLNMLFERDVKLAVATLKKQETAENVLRYCGIYQYFNEVIGMNDAESLTKSDILLQLKSKVHCNFQHDCVLIGDSIYDLEGAQLAGIDFIGVKYGFGLKNVGKDIEEKMAKYIETPEKLYNYFA